MTGEPITEVNYDEGVAHRFNQIGMGISLSEKVMEVPCDDIVKKVPAKPVAAPKPAVPLS